MGSRCTGKPRRKDYARFRAQGEERRDVGARWGSPLPAHNYCNMNSAREKEDPAGRCSVFTQNSARSAAAWRHAKIYYRQSVRDGVFAAMMLAHEKMLFCLYILPLVINVEDDTLKQQFANKVIEHSAFRRNVYNMVPEGASRVLDFGCGNGALLLRLQRDKKCTELYGIEVDRGESVHLPNHIEKVWNVNIENDFSEFAEYKGYFNYIILHDVVEHLYDPWFTLAKIRELLKDDGHILIATPNIHYWALQYQIHSGLFPYGPGLWHTGHLRWYTPISLIELLLVGGLKINGFFLEIPGQVDFSYLATTRELKHIQIPPKEYQGHKDYKNTFTVSYEQDIKKYYPVFFAHKILADCGKGEFLLEPGPMTYNCPRLAAIRKALDLPFSIFNPPVMQLLIGDWN